MDATVFSSMARELSLTLQQFVDLLHCDRIRCDRCGNLSVDTT